MVEIKPMPEAAHLTAARATLQHSWEKRRQWSRTDTARHLSDRSAPLLALLRRRPGDWPKHTHQIGYWLREHRLDLFDRAHEKLRSAASEAEREKIKTADLV